MSVGITVSGFDFIEFAKKKYQWSLNTFGPGNRTVSVLEHIRRELKEVEENPSAEEWGDVILLAMDGAARNGISPERLAEAMVDKQEVNEKRNWPDWRTVKAGEPIHHIKAEI